MDLPFARPGPRDSCRRHSIRATRDSTCAAAEGVTVKPGERAMVPTGVAVAIPDGHAGLVLPRIGVGFEEGPDARERPGPHRRGLPRRGGLRRREPRSARGGRDLARRPHRPAGDRCRAGCLAGLRRGAPASRAAAKAVSAPRVVVDDRLKLRDPVPRMMGILRTWLSGRAPPCQGGGRGFESVVRSTTSCGNAGKRHVDYSRTTYSAIRRFRASTKRIAFRR